MRIAAVFTALTLLATTTHAEDTFIATSTSIKQGAILSPLQLSEGDCKGKNLSPQISWSGAPEKTKSYAITMYDPDAPTGSGWWHWTVFNIPTSTSSIDEGATPPLASSQGRTDAGISRYAGACPPKGDAPHHYNLTVWALSESNLSLTPMSSGAMVGKVLRQTALASSTITGLYSR